MKIRQEMVPINDDTKKYMVDRESTTNNDPEKILELAMKEVLDKFASLPSKIQKDIITDIREKNVRNADYKYIVDRVKLLVQKGEELKNMETVNSDVVYRPNKSIEDLKLEEELGDLPDVDSLIEKLEELIKKKRNDEESSENKEGEKPKEWIN